ncbi:MAG: signal recognition particle protein [Desulfovibrio sp.]|jgi:signal recognition particle subunit SRP54|nr:signal recognition particle protein [Desulfovibrio sp.]
MFERLSDRLSGVFRSFGKGSRLVEENIQGGLREVRLALLEADVNFRVVKDFVERVREQCLGQEVIKGVNHAQQIVKIVHGELVALLGGETARLNLQGRQPAVIMLVGLQGSGKTTSAAKIANLLRKQKLRPYLVPADVYRPAAIEQLAVLAKQLDIPSFPSSIDMQPVDIALAAMAKARGEDIQATVLLLDTAGRLHVDEPLMEELSAIKTAVNPQEILFVADAMTGQDAVTVAEAFNGRLGLTGVVLTKMDGDARGGAALSIRAVTGTPVKFVGVGEKLSEMDIFHPDRIAGRILGMGDVLTLVEKAQSAINAEEAEALARKMQKATFDLEDFRTQMRRVKKLGSLDGILKMIPGLGGLREKLAEASGAMPEKELARTEAIINSMTMAERCNPDLLNGSRRVRIAGGAGVTVAQVNQMVRQFEQMRRMMKLMMTNKASLTGMANSPRKAMPSTGMIPGFPGMEQTLPTGRSSGGNKRKKKESRKKNKR